MIYGQVQMLEWLADNWDTQALLQQLIQMLPLARGVAPSCWTMWDALEVRII